jgi:hypothetical protein
MDVKDQATHFGVGRTSRRARRRLFLSNMPRARLLSIKSESRTRSPFEDRHGLSDSCGLVDREICASVTPIAASANQAKPVSPQEREWCRARHRGRMAEVRISIGDPQIRLIIILNHRSLFIDHYSLIIPASSARAMRLQAGQNRSPLIQDPSHRGDDSRCWTNSLRGKLAFIQVENAGMAAYAIRIMSFARGGARVASPHASTQLIRGSRSRCNLKGTLDFQMIREECLSLPLRGAMEV